MKIESLKNNIITIYKNYNFKNSKNNTINASDNSICEKSPNNPKYYQAANNINFTSNANFIALTRGKKGTPKGVIVQIPFEDGDRITLEFEQEEAKVFLDKEGAIDNKTLKAFVEIYSEFYEKTKEKSQKERIFLLSVLNDNTSNKLRAINPFNETKQALESSMGADADNYLETFLMNIRDKEERKNLASQCLKNCEDNFAKSSHTCAMEALYIISLSKNEDGLDLSNFETKTQIAVIIANFNKRVNENCFNTIIQNSKDKNGEFDISFCLKMTKIILHLFNLDEPKKMIEKLAKTLRKIEEKDPKNSSETIVTLTKFIEDGALDFSDKSDDISCFMNCFNPITEKYDKKAKELLEEFFEMLGYWYEENKPQDEMDLEYFEENYKNISLKAIEEYFNSVRNPKTGEIKENHITPADFLENYSIL